MTRPKGTLSKRAPILERLFGRRLITESGCWLYTGCTWNGYGLIGYSGRNHNVARLAYELLRGSIPKGMVPDHACHNDDKSCHGGPFCLHRRCFNPDHLLIVPTSVNNRSGRQGAYQKRRTHCPAGHPHAVFGVRYPSERGTLSCRECKRLRSAAFYRARRRALTE